MEDAVARKAEYERKMQEPIDWNSKELNFKEKVVIYNIIKKIIGLGFRFDNGLHLYDLQQHFAMVNEEVPDYAAIDNEISTHNSCIERIITEHISFDHPFRNNQEDDRCYPKHSFVRLDDELKCVCCGMTTKDFELTHDQLDFLTIVAREQGQLLKDVTKDDLPFIQVHLEREATNTALFRPSEEEDDLDPVSRAEEDYLALDGIPSSINSSVKKAHKLDLGIYDRTIMDSKYLQSGFVDLLLPELDKEIERYQNSESRFKKLMIEMCKTTKYELLILSGRNIPTLLNEAESENDKIALTKAYFNLMREYYRTSSEYFENRGEAVFYPCLTANPEINNKILEMTIRR